MLDGQPASYFELVELTLELFRGGRSGNFAGLGAGEFLVLIDDVSDLAGDGLARTGTSNLAGLVAVDGIVAGLSRGEDDVFVAFDEELCLWLVDAGIDSIAEEIGDGVMLSPDG